MCLNVKVPDCNCARLSLCPIVTPLSDHVRRCKHAFQILFYSTEYVLQLNWYFKQTACLYIVWLVTIVRTLLLDSPKRQKMEDTHLTILLPVANDVIIKVLSFTRLYILKLWSLALWLLQLLEKLAPLKIQSAQCWTRLIWLLQLLEKLAPLKIQSAQCWTVSVDHPTQLITKDIAGQSASVGPDWYFDCGFRSQLGYNGGQGGETSVTNRQFFLVMDRCSFHSLKYRGKEKLNKVCELYQLLRVNIKLHCLRRHFCLYRLYIQYAEESQEDGGHFN